MIRTRPIPQPLLSRWAWWILPTLVFGSVAATAGLLRAGGPDLPLVLLGAAFALGFLWIIVSSLNPARVDRTCPECGEEALERLDPATTRGVVCSHCGHTDPDVSAWYLAEEETTLEEIVLAERARVAGLEPEELSNARSEKTAPNAEITK